MNAPHFNVANLPFLAGNDYMKAILAEEKRCCSGIDARILEVEGEYLRMSAQLTALAKEEVHGFFAAWGMHRKMKSLVRRMSWHRDVLAKLYDARWRRTYG
jgi:hypothetical protein